MGTFILVHGAWHGGWCWKRTASILRSRGHNVFTPTHTGLGERAHLLPLLREKITLNVFIEDIVNVIKYEELSDVVLVGHSFAGVVISGVGDRIKDRLKKLVYLDALIVENGKSALESIDSLAAKGRVELAMKSSDGLSFPVPSAAAMGVHDPVLGKYVEKMVTPHPFATYDTKLTLKNPIGNGLPATYITCIDPVYPPLSASREFAARKAVEKGWKLAEIKTGHDAMITEPEMLANLLEKEAEV